MRVIRITSENLDWHLDELIALGDEFLELVCDQEPCAPARSVEILQQMVAAPGTVVLLVEDADGNAIGISYYNYGTGYSCGGSYLWLNCVYIRSAYQRRGYGTRLLDYIAEDGKSHGMKLFITCRHLDNETSRRLFDRAGFEQNEKMLMTKEF